MKVSLTLLIAIVLLSACNNSQPIKETYRDTAMAEYFKYADSVGMADTTALNYKLLKAYVNNDTTYLRGMVRNTKNAATFYRDIFNRAPRISEMNIDEGYRFSFSEAFCYYGIDATITKKDADVNLHFILYRDSLNKNVVNEFDKKLTVKDWDEFIKEMDKADFWGLKMENGIHGLDGSTLNVIGYSHRNLNYGETSKYNAVSRWGNSNPNLFGAFTLLLLYSENTKGCIVITKK